jgi:hypothetical protein
MKAEENRLNHGWTRMHTDFMNLISGSAGILPASALIPGGATGRQDAGAPRQACWSQAGLDRKSVFIGPALRDPWLRVPFACGFAVNRVKY